MYQVVEESVRAFEIRRCLNVVKSNENTEDEFVSQPLFNNDSLQ